MKTAQLRRNLPIILQSAYFLITGLWPLFHIKSFIKVTGPKTDIWLVKVFGALVAEIGVVTMWLVVAGKADRQVRLLSSGNAAVLALFDLYYFARGRLSPAYLLDAVLELAFITATWWTPRCLARKA